MSLIVWWTTSVNGLTNSTLAKMNNEHVADNPLAVMTVEVAYALPEQQWLLAVTVPVGSSVEQAIYASAVTRQVPGLVIDPERLGIFSQKARLDTVLRPGDRVEIYRPLLVDPKESRRRRAEHDGRR